MLTFFLLVFSRGTDLDPGKDSIRNEAIPKSAARVFNAQAIRDEWKEKKRKHDEDEDGHGGKRRKTGTSGEPARGPKSDKKKISLTIRPGESMQHFNRRVEDDLRPLVKSAAQSARALSRNVAREEHEARLAAKKAKKEKGKPSVSETPSKPRDHSPPPPEDKFTGRVKEFQTSSSSAPKRLNDVAQAPPEFKKLPRGASSAIGKRDAVLSMSQKVMMEQEREKAIVRYRELKASRRQAGDVGDKAEADA
ncbi:hypothetical protein M413DRAFT_288345 [Hebeloma cylindrosporum]|uniref:Uncharacterized protein n=1 Tax=Hebeloma cylindrosporum TaxID=76867 RepID=A0A0C3BYK0_HEBCY|nr:hypothetical protein M413DRAFT_288345 [Hebeloma cylindrosporum h7]